MVTDLHLEDEGKRQFSELIESLVNRNRAMARGAYEISLELDEELPSTSLGEVGTQSFRILQEALTNARRHSGAKSISVSVRTGGDDLVAEVSDDGGGFGPDTAPGIGQSSMRERAVAIGGELDIDSEPERGTRVWLRVPLPQEV